MRKAASLLGAAAAAFAVSVAPLRADEPAYRAAPVSFETLAGWDGEDHAAALSAFRRLCPAARAAQGDDLSRDARLAELCRASADPGLDPRRFLETRFRPYAIESTEGAGFLTGYYEPILDGALAADADHATPLLARPPGVETRPAGEAPGWPVGVTAARRTDAGLVPLPTRGEIEAGALGDEARPVLFLRDRVDAFVAHVQGSARVRLADGRLVRIAYDGRNGHPYTSVGRLLAVRLGVKPAAMTADAVSAWLRAHPDEAPAILAENRSFIFFRRADELDPEAGPVGAAGRPLVDGRSLAVDARFWVYGLPVWLEATWPDGSPLRRLTVAAETGSAIVGPARADLFVGSGTEAGLVAGRLRSPLRFVVLWPAALPPP